MKKEKKTDYLSNEFWNPIAKIFIFGVIIYNIISYLFFPTYLGFKCDYRTANFGPNSASIIKEFNGDPCMKDGKNRFKTYFRKEFSKKSECMNYVKYSKEISAPSDRYIVDCEKKKFKLFF